MSFISAIPVAWRLAFALALLGSVPVSAATFYVATNGSDSNPGSQGAPWRTIQKAVTNVFAGDTCRVQSGSYHERFFTIRGGSSETNRITFQAEGAATIRGFSINHPYVTVQGFDITGHSASNRNVGCGEVLANGDHFRILNNTFRDGNFLIRSDVIFTNSGGTNLTISTASGGFIAAGFQPGMRVNILLAARLTPLLNKDLARTIQSVTDQVLTLVTNEPIVNDGPVLAYLNASFNYGLNINAGASFGVVRSNRFDNLDYDAGFFGGDNNLYEKNTFTRCNGWEAFHFAGSSNVFRRNLIQNNPSPLKGYSNLSPDVFETFGTTPTTNILFEENFIQDFNGVLGVLRSGVATTMHGVIFRHNVFHNVGFFEVKIPKVSFINNTFYRVGEVATDAYQAIAHVINGGTVAGQYSADGAVIKNNIFVACGDLSQNPQSRGWYSFPGVANFVANYNFVAGPGPAFAAKSTFNEGHPELNGGDPGFVNASNPLGPDGLPFTEDDGLRLRPDSKLAGAAEGGMDVGAYALPRLSIASLPGNMVQVSWPASASPALLQSAPSVSGVWSNQWNAPSSTNAWSVFTMPAPAAPTFFRLVR